MDVIDISTSTDGGVATLSVGLLPRGATRPLDLWYRFDGLDEPLAGVNEALAAALVVPCMVEGEPLSIRGPLSAVFRANVAEAQRLLAGWYDDLRPIEIRCSGADDAVPRPADGVMCCFSAGVDSWFSLLKNESRVTHLLFVRGFDVGLDNDVLWQSALNNAATAARRMGKRLITCETNLRDVADKSRCRWGTPFAGDFWGQRLHGAALASVALLLRRSIGELIIPATHANAPLERWGSSPRLDPLWADGHVSVNHDGHDVDRLGKARRVAGSDIALATLRVCHDDTVDINCGHCEKCLRTMMALRLCGALERAKTFPPTIPWPEVHALIVPRRRWYHYVAMRDEARRIGDREVLAAAEIVMRERLSAVQTTARLRQALRGTVLGDVVRMVKRAGRPGTARPAARLHDGNG